MELENLTIKELHKLLIDREVSAQELTKFYLNRIADKDQDIKAFLSLNDKALEQAQEADKILKTEKDLPLLFAIPVAIKDNILIKGLPATAGSKILENYKASYDATVIIKLKQQRVIFLGKTNLDEFAMGSSTENSAFFKTKNPNDLERVPGGSSGGSAASVSAKMAKFALGTDTGGSIRQPASFCGVAGLKPTYGSVSRFGAIALASSLDQIGPLANTIEDLAVAFEAISGLDKFDATTSPLADFKGLSESLTDKPLDIKNLKIGVPVEFFEEGINDKVKQAVKIAISWYEKQGAKIIDIHLPYSPYGLATYYLILPAEVSANLARYDGVRYGLKVEAPTFQEVFSKTRGIGIGTEPRRRIMLGTFALSAGYYDAYYNKAQKVRRLIMEDFQKAFEKVDVLLTPTSPYTAFKFNEKIDPVSMYLSDVYTVPVNLAGIPAVSINCGFEKAGDKKLPIGLQIIGNHFQEEIILKTAYLFNKYAPKPEF